MPEISDQQIFDLLLEISRDTAGIRISVAELLFDMKSLNKELSVGRQHLMLQACLE